MTNIQLPYGRQKFVNYIDHLIKTRLKKVSMYVTMY
jgi:hypothetical protein